MSEETCPVSVTQDGWRFRPCGRPVKRNGKCGIHAAADERAERNAENRQKLRDKAKTLPSVRALLASLDESGNPLYLNVAGRLRQALREDGYGPTAEPDPEVVERLRNRPQ